MYRRPSLPFIVIFFGRWSEGRTSIYKKKKKKNKKKIPLVVQLNSQLNDFYSAGKSRKLTKTYKITMIKLQAMQDVPPLQLYPASDKFLMWNQKKAAKYL